MQKRELFGVATWYKQIAMLCLFALLQNMFECLQRRWKSSVGTMFWFKEKAKEALEVDLGYFVVLKISTTSRDGPLGYQALGQEKLRVKAKPLCLAACQHWEILARAVGGLCMCQLVKT